ncbi:MAG TPA: PAS domain S-box protein [Allosphingosinicella sp.]|jgi:PAS domain S-box-containing protein
MSDTASPPLGSGRDEAAFAALASAVVRQATTFIGICDARLRPCFVNAAGREMIGLPADADVTGLQIVDFFTAGDRAVVETVALPALLRDGHWAGDLRFRDFADESKETEVRWSAFALRGEAGGLVGAATFTSDISAGKRAERALRDQERLLASLLDNLPLGVGVYDSDGDVVHSNQSMRDYAGVTRLPSREQDPSRRWRGYDAQNRPLPPDLYPGARALRGESVLPGIDFLYGVGKGPERWLRVSAVPFRREQDDRTEAIVVVQDVDDLKRAAERVEAASAVLAAQSRFLEAALSSIPDFVYAFDPRRRFAYANAAMLGLFGLSAEEMLGKTFADLDYPRDLADLLNGHIDRVLRDGVTVEDEVFYRSPTGYGAYFDFHWGPVRAEDGSVELVVGVSRDTSHRHAIEQALRRSDARLRAATELAGLGIYSWDPVTGALEWDDRLSAMWGLPPGAEVTMEVFEAGIHPDDLPRVRQAIAECADPAGDGHYEIEYRLVRHDGGGTRQVSTYGRTIFAEGRAVDFIGAAIDVTEQRRNEAAIRASEAQFRSFADNSSSLIWIADPGQRAIVWFSAAFGKIRGESSPDVPVPFAEWLADVHPEDRPQVERALAAVSRGEVAEVEYRIVRPSDGGVRSLRETSFPILDEQGALARIGGITRDLTQEDVRQAYIVSGGAAEARRLAGIVRAEGYRARTFASSAEFLDVAPVLAPGCVIVDLRKGREEGLSIPRELKARSIPLPTIAVDAPGAEIDAAVAAMKAGAVDYVTLAKDASLRPALAKAMAECLGAVRPMTRDENAAARVARLTPREREVLVGLVEGGTNKSIGQKLGISPRTVELHRAQVTNRLNASSLTELLQIALAAGIAPSARLG